MRPLLLDHVHEERFVGVSRVRDARRGAMRIPLPPLANVPNQETREDMTIEDLPRGTIPLR